MAKNNTKEIEVYTDWVGLSKPTLMGILSVSPGRGKESFAFEYSQNWLGAEYSQVLDPDLQLYTGSYYPRDNKPNFGLFLDSCPDRWGRVLMQRREAIIARQEDRPAEKLLESDYLIGVYDELRMGALRFRINDGPFLNNNKEMSTPPWAQLRELEHASLRLEEEDIHDPEYSKWLNMLIDPGSSLGGARPKASVVDENKNLWIAKFPSRNDTKDIGAWELVTNELAALAGLNVAQGRLLQLNSQYHTYLTKRFDRTEKCKRIHFASAMTLLGYMNGENSKGASYLELVEFISRHGANVENDLEELWRRIVFNICVKNTDDHLRNHGFLLTEKGWVLSPAYDMNPNEYGSSLSLNINEMDNSLDLDLAIEVAGLFRLSAIGAANIINEIKHGVGEWRKVATKYSIPKMEQERMSVAFN